MPPLRPTGNPTEGELFSPDPGHVGGFGVLVDGVGRGLPRTVACGKEYTVVATYPYEGPVMEVMPNSGGCRELFLIIMAHYWIGCLTFSTRTRSEFTSIRCILLLVHRRIWLEC